MSKRPQPRGDKPHSDLHNASGSKQRSDISGSIHVRGEIETHIPDHVIKKHDAAEEKKEARDKFRLRVEIAGLIFVIIYAALTAWQSYSTQKIAKLTKQQLTISQRPWIGPDFGETVIHEVIDGQPIEWRVDFRNYGNSPALRVKWHTRLWVNRMAPINWHKMQSDIEHLDLSQRMEYTVFNGEKAPNMGAAYTVAFPGLSSELARGVSQVILGGIVHYWDEFGNQHTTTFCIGYNPPKGGIRPGWINCPIKPIAN